MEGKRIGPEKIERFCNFVDRTLNISVILTHFGGNLLSTHSIYVAALLVAHSRVHAELMSTAEDAHLYFRSRVGKLRI